MSRLRLGFIGAGFIAKFQATAMKMVRNTELAGVYALKGAEELAAFAREAGIGECRVCSSVAELCDLCEAVAVFVPNFARLEIIGAIAEARKAGAELKGVICEKPLGRTVAEATEIVRLGRGMQVPLSYWENQLLMKPVRAALKQLEPVQKAMGAPTLARSSEEHGGPHEPWFWDPTRQGGGVLSDMGCHSIACSWFVLTPIGKPLTYLQPVSVSADTSLLKWGRPAYRQQLLERMGVDYAKTPAEDFTTGIITFRNPDDGQLVKAQFTNSWMYDKQGLRLFMDGLGPGYSFEVNSLTSPVQVFVGDAAAEAVADAETALEKSTASHGLLSVLHNEADVYGYVDEIEESAEAFLQGRDGFASWEYGLEITRLVQAAYLAAERRQVIDLTSPEVQAELETYVPLIAQGRGAEVLL